MPYTHIYSSVCAQSLVVGVLQLSPNVGLSLAIGHAHMHACMHQLYSIFQATEFYNLVIIIIIMVLSRASLLHIRYGSESLSIIEVSRSII
jgi:hypothetical protein